MKIFKELKQKIKDNKGKIIIGIVVISGVTCFIVKQNNTIKNLKLNDIKQQKDIDILKSVMSKNVLSSLKEAITRKLRYQEGRLNNGLKDGVITKTDEIKLREEIYFFNNELTKIIQAEELLK